MRKALTSFINLLKPYKVPPLFQRMKTDNASKKNKNKTYSTECEAALAKPLTFIWGKIQHWSAARVNYPACPQNT